MVRNAKALIWATGWLAASKTSQKLDLPRFLSRHFGICSKSVDDFLCPFCYRAGFGVAAAIQVNAAELIVLAEYEANAVVPALLVAVPSEIKVSPCRRVVCLSRIASCHRIDSKSSGRKSPTRRSSPNWPINTPQTQWSSAKELLDNPPLSVFRFYAEKNLFTSVCLVQPSTGSPIRGVWLSTVVRGGGVRSSFKHGRSQWNCSGLSYHQGRQLFFKVVVILANLFLPSPCRVGGPRGSYRRAASACSCGEKR